MGANNARTKTIPLIKQKEKIRIHVATLNYGVSDCPFEYTTISNGVLQNQEQKISQNLNNKFKQVFQQEKGIKLDSSFSWQTGNVQKKFKLNRFSPLYYPKIGIEKLNFLMNKQQFKKSWYKAFQKYKATTMQPLQMKEQHIENTLQLDWICYHTIVSYVYKNNNIDEVVSTQTAEKYKNFMIKQFQKKTIDQNYKIQKIFTSLQKFQIDIFFLQEASNKILQVIQSKSNKYRIVSGKNSDSIILISWNLCQKLLGRYAYKTLKFYNDSYIKYADLFIHKAQLLGGLESYSSVNKRQSMLDTTKNNFGAFIGISRTLSNIQSQQSPQKIKHKTSQLSMMQLKKGQSIMQQGIQYEQNVLQQSSSSSSSSSEDQQQMKITSNYKNRKYLNISTIQKFNFNGNSVVQFLGNLILFSIHLTSSTKDLQKKIRQKQSVIQVLKTLQKQYPDHTIIVGGAFNQVLNSQQFPGINLFPEANSNVYTVFKKRTYLQGQISKANIQVKKAFDYLISTTNIQKGKIVTIDNKQVDDLFLIPNQTHPYDHYIVSGYIQFQQNFNFNLRKIK